MSAEMVAAGASAISGVLGYKGNMAAAKQAKATADYEAQVLKNEAILLERAKVDEERVLRQNAERLIATQNVATAASGIQMSGSALQATADAYFNTELDALRIQYASDIEQTKSVSDQMLVRAEGRARAAAKRTDAYASLLGGTYQSASVLREA